MVKNWSQCSCGNFSIHLHTSHRVRVNTILNQNFFPIYSIPCNYVCVHIRLLVRIKCFEPNVKGPCILWYNWKFSIKSTKNFINTIWIDARLVSISPYGCCQTQYHRMISLRITSISYWCCIELKKYTLTLLFCSWK